MKILIAAIGHFLDHPSGSAKVAYDEACSLRDRGCEVWMLAQGVPRLPEYEERFGIHVLRYFPKEVAAWNPRRGFAHQSAAQEVLRRRLPAVDAVHGHVPLSFLAAARFYNRSVHKAYTVHSPVTLEMSIVWKHSSGLRKALAPMGLAFIKRMEAECLETANVVTALSQYTIDAIAQVHSRRLADKIHLVPGWVDSERFVPVENREAAKHSLGWPGDVPLLFTLRRLQPRMGLDRLIDALSLLHAVGSKAHLVIGGSGPLRADLEAQVRRLGLENSITFMGRVSEEALPKAYGACDAFVLPTTALECFGLIALEAMSAGRPVLATPIAAIPEIVGAIEPAWLAASAEAADIADLLGRFFAGRLPSRDPDQLHGLIASQYGIERVLPNFLATAFPMLVQN